MMKIKKEFPITKILFITLVVVISASIVEAKDTFYLRVPMENNRRQQSLYKIAEMAFMKRWDEKEYGNQVLAINMILAAQMIDQLGIGQEDNVLCVGTGDVIWHPVACAIRKGRVDIVQPDTYHGHDQGAGFAKNLEDYRKFFITFFGYDLISNRIDTETYKGYIEKVAIRSKYYTYVFLLNVLEIIPEDGKEFFINTVLFSLKDNATILISAYMTSVSEQINILSRYAEKRGYSIVKSRSFESKETVYELKVYRNIGEKEISFGEIPEACL